MAGVPTTTTIGSALSGRSIGRVAWLFQQTRLCLRLRASREDEPAARALGIGVVADALIAFVLSAFICGVAGGLYAQFLGSFGPSFFLTTTFTVVAMLVVGGRYSLSGAVIGRCSSRDRDRVPAPVRGRSSLSGAARPGAPRPSGGRPALALLLMLLLRPRGITGGAR